MYSHVNRGVTREWGTSGGVRRSDDTRLANQRTHTERYSNRAGKRMWEGLTSEHQATNYTPKFVSTGVGIRSKETERGPDTSCLTGRWQTTWKEEEHWTEGENCDEALSFSLSLFLSVCIPHSRSVPDSPCRVRWTSAWRTTSGCLALCRILLEATRQTVRGIPTERNRQWAISCKYWIPWSLSFSLWSLSLSLSLWCLTVWLCLSMCGSDGSSCFPLLLFGCRWWLLVHSSCSEYLHLLIPSRPLPTLPRTLPPAKNRTY